MHPQPSAHAILVRSQGDTTLLTGGQRGEKKMRSITAKYSKFAYSSRFAFSVLSDSRTPSQLAPDNALCFSEGHDTPWIMRDACTFAYTTNQYNATKWNAGRVASISTLLIPINRFHLRIHIVEVQRQCQCIEGGFAQPFAESASSVNDHLEQNAVTIWSQQGTSAIFSLDIPSRQPSTLRSDPGTNLYFPRACVPLLECTLEPGRTTLVTAIYASSSQDTVDEFLRKLPTVNHTNGIFDVSAGSFELSIDSQHAFAEPNNQLGAFTQKAE
ncbi:MAG: hypothetical protein AAGB34_09675 [Planctomycetota bacterium]